LGAYEMKIFAILEANFLLTCKNIFRFWVKLCFCPFSWGMRDEEGEKVLVEKFNSQEIK
jgi:hypothetical protein